MTDGGRQQRMVRCTACDGEDVREEPFYYRWRGRRFAMVRCATCTHQFVHPPVSAADQEHMYGDAYFAQGGDWVCGLYEGKGYAEAREELIQEAQEILDLLPLREGRLLDIGCAGGIFLNEARSAGFQVQGIEINATQAEEARSTFHLDVLTTRIEEAPSTLGPFDVVTLLDVLEHVPRPLTVLRKVLGWMPQGALLLIRGPMSNRPITRIKEALRRAVGPTKQLPGYPLDANVFNPRSLPAMLLAAGFTPLRTWSRPDFANVLAIRSGVPSGGTTHRAMTSPEV